MDFHRGNWRGGLFFLNSFQKGSLLSLAHPRAGCDAITLTRITARWQNAYLELFHVVQHLPPRPAKCLRLLLELIEKLAKLNLSHLTGRVSHLTVCVCSSARTPQSFVSRTSTCVPQPGSPLQKRSSPRSGVLKKKILIV
jgi:hypothetical protein